jgi:putative transposase
MVVRPPDPPITPSREALSRYLAVSLVLSRERAGEPRPVAVAAVADRELPAAGHDGRAARRRGARTLYRWLEAFERHGLAGLEPAARPRVKDSAVLPAKLLRFLEAEKRNDLHASVPELIRRARELGVVAADVPLDRVTVWRACQRLGLPLARRKRAKDRDARRWAYPHRLDLVLCDGKHFRAGPNRDKRVALFFLDDATRFGLHVVVGTAGESAELFLRGLYECIRRHGIAGIYYLDGGPGFIADDTTEVIARLGSLLLHGETRYPEGHGKVEKFNQTALARLLRHLPGRADVDPAPGALELRLAHFLREQYNHTPHESLDGDTPHERFMADTKVLRLPESDAELRQRFVVHVERRVSNDHIVQLDGVDYEMPRGHAGERVVLHRRVLDGTVAALHDGRLVDLAPVDVVANAHDRRARPGAPADGGEPALTITRGAADIAFARAHRPVVAKDGGFARIPEETDDDT